MSKEKKYVPVTSGKLHAMAYEMYVLSTANELVEKFGITKDEAIKKVKEALPEEQCVVTVREDMVGDAKRAAI